MTAVLVSTNHPGHFCLDQARGVPQLLPCVSGISTVCAFRGIIRVTFDAQNTQQHVEAKTIVKLLPGPGDGEKLAQLPSQKTLDLVVGFLSGPL